MTAILAFCDHMTISPQLVLNSCPHLDFKVVSEYLEASLGISGYYQGTAMPVSEVSSNDPQKRFKTGWISILFVILKSKIASIWFVI